MWICGCPVKGHHFLAFPNIVWEGNVFGAILEKVKPREKPYQEYVDLWWSCQRSSFI